MLARGSIAFLSALAVLALLSVSGAGAAPLDRLIAPSSACPGANIGAPIGKQVRAMHCMTDYARARHGKPALVDVAVLDRAAARKSADLLRCDRFEHEACGRPFTYWMERLGYLGGGCSAAGENIAWGIGSLGSVRSIFKAWIRSSGHRANILGEFEDLGIGLRVGNLEGNARARVWTQDFGSRGC